MTAESELETLKAQLADSQQQVEQLCGDCKTIQRDYTDAHQAQLSAEAQVRELREALGECVQSVPSEQVPAASDGFTGSREVREDVRGTSTADKSVEYSEPQDSPSRSPISIEVFQQDWMPGYAAFRDDGSLQDGAKAHVCLNLSSFLGGVQIGELTAADLPYLIAESIMHEVMHVLESWANVEFSEERVEALLTKYRDKYHPEAPVYQACPEREAPDEQAFKVRNWRDAQIAELFEIKKVNLFCYKLYLGGVLLGADASEKRAHNRAQQILTTISKAIQDTSPAPPSPAREKEKAE